jgi:uncharacterized protein
MVLENIIEQVIAGQEQKSTGGLVVTRNRKVNLNEDRIIIISGVRRCGKSTFLKQLNLNELAMYVNFEDTRLEGFELGDFIKLERIALRKSKINLLFDEVQNISGWEKYARSAHERGIKLQITGSNASMLSRELGSRLTGRYVQIEMFPFSYIEFLAFTSQSAGVDSFQMYLELGGFPEFLKSRDTDYLRTLLRDIVIRDIAVRKTIRNENYLLRLAVHLLSNVGKEFSYNKLTKLLEIKSIRTTIDYCDFLQESYLIELVPCFSYSIKKQLANPKKIYCVDTAMAKANSLSLSKDVGRLLENAVFLHLRRTFSAIYYFRNENAECDFLVKYAESIILAVQVCFEINEDNMKRELAGIKEALAFTGCKTGIIITSEQEDEIDGIALIPAWKWFGADLQME